MQIRHALQLAKRLKIVSLLVLNTDFQSHKDKYAPLGYSKHQGDCQDRQRNAFKRIALSRVGENKTACLQVALPSQRSLVAAAASLDNNKMPTQSNIDANRFETSRLLHKKTIRFISPTNHTGGACGGHIVGGRYANLIGV